MEVKAIAKYVRVQPRKVRIIADEVRGSSATYVASQLRYHTSKSAHALHKVLISAMANAQENHGVSPDRLRISTITVDEGPRLKRMRARAMGRGARILKKTSHITVVVSDDLDTTVVKPHGTKPKPRPTLGAPKRKGADRSGATTVVAAAPAETTVIAAEPVVEEAPVEVVEQVEVSTEGSATVEAEASEDKGAL